MSGVSCGISIGIDNSINNDRLFLPVIRYNMTKATTPHHSLVDPMGWTLGFLLCSILLAFLMPKSPRTRFPVVNRYRWDYFQTKAKHEFERRAQELIEAGLKQSAVFDMETNMGPRVVISDKFADAVGMDDRLDQHKGITPVGDSTCQQVLCQKSDECELCRSTSRN